MRIYIDEDDAAAAKNLARQHFAGAAAWRNGMVLMPQPSRAAALMNPRIAVFLIVLGGAPGACGCWRCWPWLVPGGTLRV